MSPLDAPHSQHTFIVSALKRSGQHAIIHWLLSHFDGPCAHLNNVEWWREELHGNPPPRVASTTARRALLSGLSSAFYLDARCLGHVRHVDAHQVFDTAADRLRASRNVEAALRLALGIGEHLDATLLNLEDVDMSTWESLPDALLARGSSTHRHRLLIVRDLGNLIASRLKGGYVVNDAVLEAWESQARAALDPDEDLVVVDFVQWHRSEAARRRLSQRLGLAFTDRGREHVPDFGPVGRSGSSFDARNYEGRASAMAVTGRWRAFADDPRWRTICLDERRRALSRRLFGWDVLEDPP